jgi:gamma-glutamyltranspeptidase/glutathione hydrolase
MNIIRLFLLAVGALVFDSSVLAANEVNWQASGNNGAVVAGRPPSADAGLSILRQGGNAADAAAAALLALAVTDSPAFCFGGEVSIIVYDANRKTVEVVAGIGTAPRLATLEYFQKAGGIKGGTPQSAAIPASLDACITLLDRYGTITFARAAEPALQLLDGQKEKWHTDLAKTLRRLIDAEKAATDRRGGLRLVCDYFYRGPIAREIDAWSRANNGLIRYTDLAAHVTRIEEPVKIDYRGFTVYKCNTWTQGPWLLQALKLLEGFNLKSMGLNQPGTIHAIIEASKLALADRDMYYADPLFVDVPLRQLLSNEYTNLRRPLIDMNAASTTLRPGDPLGLKAMLDSNNIGPGLGTHANDTSTCIVADRRGNVVVATPSGWGGVLAGNTGIRLGSRLISFNTWKGHPNCIEPGKRPRITLTPTLVLKDGEPVLAISVAGGDTQDQATLQMLINYIDFNLPGDRVVSTPRYATEHFIGSFNQTPPTLGGLTISPQFGADCIEQLRKLGHKVNPKDPNGRVPQDRTVLVIDHKTGMFYAAGDPNADIPRSAAAF